MSLSSHTQGVTSIRWSGDDLIYSASQDRTIKVTVTDYKYCLQFVLYTLHTLHCVLSCTVTSSNQYVNLI